MSLFVSSFFLVGTASAVTEGPTGTLVVEPTDEAVVFRAFDSNANNVPDIEVSNAFTGNGVYLDIAIIDGSQGATLSSIVSDTAAPTAWTITATNAGNVVVSGFAVLDFNGIENLTGGADSDTFSLNTDISGLVDGGIGDDTVIGIAAGNTFVVDAPNSGTSNGTAFTNVENLTGGPAADTFTFSAVLGDAVPGGSGPDSSTFSATLSGTAAGFAGDDTYIMLDGGSVGVFAGGAGFDTVTFANATSGVTVDLSGFVNIEFVVGSLQSDAFVVNVGADSLQIDGGPATDLVVGSSAVNTWTLDSNGSVSEGGNTISFVNVEAVSGGANVDTFDLIGSFFGGNVSGGDGDDLFNVGASQFGQLDGGEGSDTFRLADGVVFGFPGVAIDGGADAAGDDNDVLDLSATTVAAALVLTGSTLDEGFAGTEPTVFTAAGGGFDGIDQIAGSGTGTLAGRNVTSVWRTSSYDDQSAILTFSGFSVAIGVAANDWLFGTLGNDVFSSDGPGRVNLNGQDFEGMELVNGGDGDDIFDLTGDFGSSIFGGNGDDSFFLSVTQSGLLSGNDGNDTFELLADVSAAQIDGGAGTDNVVITDSAATNLNTVNIENFEFVPELLANGGFESGDFSSWIQTGNNFGDLADYQVISGLGSVTPTEGSFMAMVQGIHPLTDFNFLSTVAFNWSRYTTVCFDIKVLYNGIVPAGSMPFEATAAQPSTAQPVLASMIADPASYSTVNAISGAQDLNQMYLPGGDTGFDSMTEWEKFCFDPSAISFGSSNPDTAPYTSLSLNLLFGWSGGSFSDQAFLIDNVRGIRSDLDDIAGTGDINLNGFADIAITQTGSTRVHVRDGLTGELISDIDFGDDPVSAMSVIDDINGNGQSEIALLGTRPDGNVRVQVRDSANGQSINNVFYGSSYSAVDMAVLPDTDGNGAAELLVLGADSAGGVRVRARDALSDATTSITFYGNNAQPIDVLALPDLSANGEPEVLVHGLVSASGQGRAQMRDTSTRAFLRNVFFGSAYTPLQLASTQDISGDGIPDLVQLGRRDGTGQVRIQTKRSDTGATIANAFIGNTDVPVAVLGISDANGNGSPDVAVLVERPNGTAKVVVRDGATGAFIRNIFAGAVSRPVNMALVPDLDASGDAELAILGDDSAGVRRVQIKDSISGAQVNTIDFP